MTGCNTGPERLPKPLAATGAVIGHKTGSATGTAPEPSSERMTSDSYSCPTASTTRLRYSSRIRRESAGDRTDNRRGIRHRLSIHGTAGIISRPHCRSFHAREATVSGQHKYHADGTASTTAAGGTPAAIGNQSIPRMPIPQRTGAAHMRAPGHSADTGAYMTIAPSRLRSRKTAATVRME